MTEPFQIGHDEELEALFRTRLLDADTNDVHWIDLDVALEEGVYLGRWATLHNKPVYKLSEGDGSGALIAGTPEDIRNFLLHQSLLADDDFADEDD